MLKERFNDVSVSIYCLCFVQTYGCNVTPDSFCWNGKGVAVEIAYQGKSPPGSSNYFKLKITQYENFKVDCKNPFNSKLYSMHFVL